MLFVEALGSLSPFSTIPPARGRWRVRWRNHYSFCGALPLENAGASWRHRGRLPYSAGRALRLPSIVPGVFAAMAKLAAGGPAPVAMLLAGGS